MARLTGVQTVDMQGGEITKITYNGAEYAKVDDKAKAGDLMRPNGRHSEHNIKHHEYYRVIEDGGGSVKVVDDEGDDNGLARNMVDVFRKVSHSPQVSTSFAEMITSKVEAVEKDVTSLEQRVTALEVDKPTQELAKGMWVKALANSEYGDIKAGEYGRIDELDCGSESDPYSIAVETEESYCYFRPQDLEIVARDEEETFKTGDIVVITANTNGSRNAVGDIGKVGYSGSSITAKVHVPGKTRGRGNNTRYNEMRLANALERTLYEEVVESERVKTEAQAKDREALAKAFTKAGREPNELRKSDVVRVIESPSASPVGTIIEIVHVRRCNTIRGNDEFVYAPRNVEIVCFAEDRKDNSKGGR